MKLNRRANQRSGLTILEVLVIVATVCVLIVLFIPSPCSSKKAWVTVCANNLKQLTLGTAAWSFDHDSTNLLPAQLSTNLGGFHEPLLRGNLSDYYRSLSNNFTTPHILTCPSDSRKPADDFTSLTTNHLSYFLNMDATSGPDTSTVLHGDRHIVFTPAARTQPVLVTTNLSVAWAKNAGHSRTTGVGNIALVDGSVARATDRDLSESLLTPAWVSVQRLLFP